MITWTESLSPVSRWNIFNSTSRAGTERGAHQDEKLALPCGGLTLGDGKDADKPGYGKPGHPAHSGMA